MTDITSVSQLKDVQTTDWYFKHLQSLIERFGIGVYCPDGMFNANEPMSRAEAVSLLNQALDRVLELIATSTSEAK
jgi:S-layer homology domain